MTLVYGVDLEKKVTPKLVRGAIIECFYQAHQKVLEDMYTIFRKGKIDDENSEIGRKYVQETIANYFIKVNGDFNKPTKESILAVMNELKTFSIGFRSLEVIEKHYGEIMKLVEKMED